HFRRRGDDGDVAVPLDLDRLTLRRLRHGEDRLSGTRLMTALRLPTAPRRIKIEGREKGGRPARAGRPPAQRFSDASTPLTFTLPIFGTLVSTLTLSRVWAEPTLPASSTASTLRKISGGSVSVA